MSGNLAPVAQRSTTFRADIQGLRAIAQDLKDLPAKSRLANRVCSLRPWLNVSKFVTPIIFMGIFASLMLALFA